MLCKEGSAVVREQIGGEGKAVVEVMGCRKIVMLQGRKFLPPGAVAGMVVMVDGVQLIERSVGSSVGGAG